MFEDLQQRRGFGGKEKARLIVSAALILVFGTVIYGSRSCSEAPPAPTLPKATEPTPAAPPPARLDPARFEEVAAGRADPSRFDAKALDFALQELAADRLARTPSREFDGPAALAALDLKEWAGRLVETRGRVRSLDKETYASKALPGTDLLWAFALEGADGSRVVVVQGGSSEEHDRDRPADAYHPGSAPVPLGEGEFVRVRGVVLQRRTGLVGSLSLDAPTLVLVGREYRRTDSAVPDIPSLDAVDWRSVQDRTMAQTRRVDDAVHYQLLHWARSRGHDAALAEVRARGPIGFWGQPEFLQFKADLESDHGQEEDPRRWTVAQRGRAFTTTGVLADYSTEDWDTVGPNDYDVVTRYKYWIVSDYYAHSLILLDSAFPIETFPGLRPPREGERPRVVVTGVYVRNYSYTPRAASGRPEGKSEITIPYFQLLDVRLRGAPPRTPLLENPFFWAWVSLAVFGIAFFAVMGRIERREAAMMREKEKMVRAGARRATRRRETPPPGEPPPAGPGAPTP